MSDSITDKSSENQDSPWIPFLPGKPVALAEAPLERAIKTAWLLGLALLLGLLGDGLFYGWHFGLSWGLWVSAVVLALVVASRVTKQPLEGQGRWLLGVGVVFAFFAAWRASEALQMLNFLATLLTIGLAAAATRQGQLVTARVVGIALSWLHAGIGAATDVLGLIFIDMPWNTLPKPRSSEKTAAIFRGVLFAVPVLIVFGALFASADAVFGKLLGNLTSLQFNAEGLIQHGIVIGFFAWIVGGFLRRALKPQTILETQSAGTLVLPATEMTVVLGLVSALFAAFVLVQIGYFFGGSNQISVTGLTYSEYARKGFFELVWVATLALPMLLVMHSLIPEARVAQQKTFRVLASILVGLIAIVMVSAVQRMRLYVLEYGLTELRLYPTVFMLWLAIVFGWFVWVLYRNHRDQFAFGALASAMAILIGLNAINPDAVIVKYNAIRSSQNNEVKLEESGGLLAARRSARVQKTLDTDYALTLSADAVPALLEVIAERKADPTMAGVRQILSERWSTESPDWRSWKWGVTQAKWAIGQRESR
jgi:Domain of unknown function (DUF4173)